MKAGTKPFWSSLPKNRILFFFFLIYLEMGTAVLLFGISFWKSYDSKLATAKYKTWNLVVFALFPKGTVIGLLHEN